jgi:hypothetical protein
MQLLSFSRWLVEGVVFALSAVVVDIRTIGMLPSSRFRGLPVGDVSGYVV